MLCSPGGGCTSSLFHPAHHILGLVRRRVHRSLRLIYLSFGLSFVSPQSIIVSSVHLQSLFSLYSNPESPLLCVPSSHLAEDDRRVRLNEDPPAFAYPPPPAAPLLCPANSMSPPTSKVGEGFMFINDPLNESTASMSCGPSSMIGFTWEEVARASRPLPPPALPPPPARPPRIPCAVPSPPIKALTASSLGDPDPPDPPDWLRRRAMPAPSTLRVLPPRMSRPEFVRGSDIGNCAPASSRSSEK